MIECDFDKIAWCLFQKDYDNFRKNIREIFLEHGFDIWLDRDVDYIVKEVLDLLEEAEVHTCNANHTECQNYLILYWQTEFDWIDDPTLAVEALHRYITDVYKGYCDYMVISEDGKVSRFCESLYYIRPFIGFTGIGERKERKHEKD